MISRACTRQHIHAGYRLSSSSTIHSPARLLHPHRQTQRFIVCATNQRSSLNDQLGPSEQRSAVPDAQQQMQQQHWMLQHISSQRAASTLLAAALLALLSGSSKRAVAASLPPPWHITMHDQRSISSSNSSSAYAQQRSSAAAAPAAAAPAGGSSYASAAEGLLHNTAVTNSLSSSSSSAGVSSTLMPTSTNSSSSLGGSSIGGGSSGSSSTNGASGSSTAAAAAAAASNALDELLAYERATVNLFAAACPSVVNITHMRAMQNFWTLDVHRMAVGQGSGFIWDRAGHVVTNYHVIKGAAEMKVTLHDHSSCTARVVGFDPSKDIAVLKLALPRGRLEALSPVTLGNSAGLKVGQAVFAIGNPFGLDHTLTQGVVSGLGRELSTGLSAIKGVIQTDAAINPGNSGGVLLNSQGAVIGVNLGLLDPSGKGSFSGVGFAAPIDTVKGLVDQILVHGRVRRPSLGITLAPEQVLVQLGTEGVLVLEVPAGTPAAAAGLRATYRDVFGDIVLGDIIVGVDTRPIRSVPDLVAALDERRPGDKVRCDVLRDGKRLSMTVTLGERGMCCE